MVVVFPRVTVSRDFIDYPYFADLGAIQAAATLRAAGAGVGLADALALGGSTLVPAREALAGGAEGDVVLGASEDELFEKIAQVARNEGDRAGGTGRGGGGATGEVEAFVVAITPFHRPPMRDATLGGTLARLREEHPAAAIVLADLYQSGQHVVDARSEDIAASYPEIDALVRYEAEAVLAGVVEEAVRERRVKQAPGATDRGAAVRIVNGADPPRLDDLPLPAWDLVDLPAYFAFHERVTARLGRPSWAFPITGRAAPALTSRGCPYRCVHCSSNPGSRREGVQIAPKTQRRYSAAYLDRLFGDLVSRGVRRVHLLDELTNVNEAHFDAVLDLLRKHRLAFEIPNGLRADYVLPRHLERMRGQLTTLSVSAESGVQSVVDRVVDKQLDLGAITRVAEDARAAKVPVLVHFMIGLPGETAEEIRGTLDFALGLREKHGALPSVQFATPLPGTRLSRTAEEAEAANERGGLSTASLEAGAEESSVGVAGGRAAGSRRLPVVRDWGPLFQQVPSTRSAAFDPDHLRKARRAFEMRMRAIEGPRRVIVSPTYRCNNRCPFCTTGTMGLAEPDFGALRERLVAERKAGAEALSIDGGEPTLSERLMPLIGFARKIGYRAVDVTTNGRMASYPEYARRLASSGVTAVWVSIHGPDAATHALHVGADEAFEQACTGVRNLVSSGGVEIGIKTTVTRRSGDRLFEMGSLVERLGAGRWALQAMTGFGPGTTALAAEPESAAREIERVIRSFGERLRIRVDHVPPCLLPDRTEVLSADAEELSGKLVCADPNVDVLADARSRRLRKAECATCPFAVTCLGFHATDDSRAPAWVPFERVSERASR